jgi:hypothetical protein
MHYMPDIDELMKKVHRTRFCTPVSQYSKTHKTPFTGTGLLTSDKIIRKEGLDEEIRQRMRGFRSDTSNTSDMLATSDIDPVNVALHEAVVPRPSKRQWILKMSPDERNCMLRFVSLAISRTGGMTEVTRLIIGKEFRISPALVDVIASWVMSSEVDDDKLPDDQ